MGVIYNRNRKKALLFIPSGGLGPSVSADFSYSKSTFHQGEADPTPTITGTAGGTFNADAGVVFVDTGSFNSSTGQIDLSATTIDSHIITYTVDGVQSGQTVGVESSPYSSTSSFSFDGVNDYFELGTDSSLDIFGGDFSVSLWFNHSISSPNKQPLIEIASFTNKMALTLGLSGNTGVGFAVGSGTPVWNYNAGNGYNDGNWHNIVATKTGTTYKIFVDNTELSFSTGAWSVGSNNRIAVGRSVPIYFAGKIDEVSIWNTALSSDAVTEIYNSGAPSELTSLTNASSSNLKAWYKM